MNVCPTCHRPFTKSTRFCFACGRPIGRKDKWHCEGCYVVHDDCANPTIGTLVVRTIAPAEKPRELNLSGETQQEG